MKGASISGKAREPLRILLAHSFYRIPGGEDRYVRQQAELLSRDHTVELIESRNDLLSETVTTAAGMVYSLKCRRETSAIVARFAPDVVHVHNVYPSLGPAVHLAAAEAGLPLVMTVHNYRLRCPNGLRYTQGSLCRRCERGNYLQALTHDCFPSLQQAFAYSGALWLHRYIVKLEGKVSLFICPSEFVRNELVSYGIPQKRVVTIPNFVQMNRESDAEPGNFGVFVGRLSSEKGVDVLLQALQIARDPPFRVVGDGPMAGFLRSRAAKLGLKRTEFLGSVSHDRVVDIVQKSRYLAMPSLWNETGGLAALEAMALGRPLLVTSLGGLPELVREGTGLICSPGDPGELAAGIERLMADEAFCREAGARGLSVTVDHFGPRQHSLRLEAAYRMCIDEGATTL